MKPGSAVAIVAVLLARLRRGLRRRIRWTQLTTGPAARTASVAHPVLELRALDKITGRASVCWRRSMCR